MQNSRQHKCESEHTVRKSSGRSHIKASPSNSPAVEVVNFTQATGDRQSRLQALQRTLQRRSALVLCRSGLTRFGFGAFFERCFTRKFHAAFVVDPDALDPNDVANLGNVFGSLYPEIRELGNVHESIPARENFDK